MWLSDITYLWTKEGGVFVACMLDLFTREIVGWAIDSHMRKSLVHDALKRAEFRNGFTQKSGVDGLTFHSDKAVSTPRTKHAIICRRWATGNRCVERAIAKIARRWSASGTA